MNWAKLTFPPINLWSAPRMSDHEKAINQVIKKSLTTEKPSALDEQIGGNHYKYFKIQPVKFIEENNLAFLEGCVIKRLCRHEKKTGKGRQDIEKAIHELQLLLELRYGKV